MCRDVTKGTLRRENKMEFCIAFSRGHSAGHFDTKIRCLGVSANCVIQNMYYEKLNLLSKFISTFYIQFRTKVGISHSSIN